MAEGRQRAVGRIVRSGESERGRRHRAKEGDTTEETFQMCYRLLNKFRVKLPDIVSTAVAPAGRKWRIKAANLPVFIRLFVAPRVAAPLLFPRRFRALARKEYVCAFVKETKSRAIDTRDECQRRDRNQLITRELWYSPVVRKLSVFRRNIHRSLVIIDTKDSQSFSVD